MKKIILCLIAAVSISNLSFGQATLEHSYTTKVIGWEQTNLFKTDAGLNYYTVEGTNTLKFYNNTHSLTNTITIPIDSGYVLDGIYGVSDKLFNTDILIEFLVFTRIENSSGTLFKLSLVNQEGIILQQFGNKNEAYVIKGTSDDYKLITFLDKDYSIPPSTDYIFDVYSLPGNSLGTVLLNRKASSFFGYPNPTENIISITNNLEIGQNGTLEVFDINGKKVMQKNVTGQNKEIRLDTSELSIGTYLYKLNNKINRFIKK